MRHSRSMVYDEVSRYYDAIYEAMKDYAAEAQRLRRLLEHYALRPVRDLLDMACGTGLHDQYLQDHYYVEGAALSPSQLAIARRRCPDLVFHEADMARASAHGRSSRSAVGAMPAQDGL